jgi:hypothetical protein
MAEQSSSRGDSPAPTTPGKPVEHGSRQQRTKEPTPPAKQPARAAEEKQPPSGPTPPGAK